METTETQILTPAPKINLENVSLKKIAPICKRTFNHINIENFCEFLNKKDQRLSRACIVHLVIKKTNWSYVKTMSCVILELRST